MIIQQPLKMIFEKIRAFRGINLPFLADIRIPGALIKTMVWSFFIVTFMWYWAGTFLSQYLIQDESYMALCCRYYREQPLAMLTFFAGRVAMVLFGDHIIVLRGLASASMLGAALIPCCFFYRRTRNLLWTLFILAVCMIAIRCTRNEFYSWDSAPAVLYGWLLTIMVSYIGSPRRIKTLLAAAVLALVVLARVPAALVAVPACVAIVLAVESRLKKSAMEKLKSIGLCLCVFVAVTAVTVTVMSGSPAAYIHSWVPENIINGHKMDDVLHGPGHWNFTIWTAAYICGSYFLFRYMFVAVAVVRCINRRSRLVAGLALVLALTCYNVVYDQWVVYPLYVVALGLLLYAPCHNFVERHIRRGSDMERVDPLVVVAVVAFALVPVVGSDHVLVRFIFYYSIPLLMVQLYRRRNGVILWLMLFMTVPALAAGIRNAIWQFTDSSRFAVGKLPRRELVVDFRENLEFFLPLAEATSAMEKSGDRYIFMGYHRYEPMYFYKSGRPYRLNHFHYYYEQDARDFIRTIPDSVDAVVIRRSDLPELSYEEIGSEFGAKGYALADSAGIYDIYRKQVAERATP